MKNKKIERKYNRIMGNFLSQSGGGDDRTMFYKQLGKYEKYLESLRMKRQKK